MKRRLFISLGIIVLLILLMPVAIILLELKGQGIFSIIMVVIIIYVFIYVFFGLPKMIVGFIYGVVIFMFLALADEPYHLPIAIIGSLTFLFNPLYSIENYLNKRIVKEEALPLRFSIRGSYWPYYQYRKEMKNYYHLPQTKKLYSLKWYLQLRQVLTIILFLTGIVILINSLSVIGNSLEDFSWINFFNFYYVVIIFLLAYYSFKKGFTSTLRTLIIAIFPPVIYTILLAPFSNVVKYSFSGATFIIFIILGIIEIYKYYTRVAYESYDYYDIDHQINVHANALFEPLVYNEIFINYAIYKINVKDSEFNKVFKDILIYANYFRIFIVGYTNDKKHISIHTNFHHKEIVRIDKFKTFLERIFERNVGLSSFRDPDKEFYEKNFFHRPGYIISRALSLASLAKDLKMNENIILSMIVYFESRENLRSFQEKYQITILEELSEESYISARVDIHTRNIDYVIEEKLRELLLDLLIHDGNYVRIQVFY